MHTGCVLHTSALLNESSADLHSATCCRWRRRPWRRFTSSGQRQRVRRAVCVVVRLRCGGQRRRRCWKCSRRRLRRRTLQRRQQTAASGRERGSSCGSSQQEAEIAIAGPRQRLHLAVAGQRPRVSACLGNRTLSFLLSGDVILTFLQYWSILPQKRDLRMRHICPWFSLSTACALHMRSYMRLEPHINHVFLRPFLAGTLTARRTCRWSRRPLQRSDGSC